MYNIKYTLVPGSEISTRNGATLHRIRALRDIPLHGVKAGDLGGYVESESNLSCFGDCWIDGLACVWDGAIVMDDALMSGNATACGNVVISQNAHVGDRVSLERDAQV